VSGGVFQVSGVDRSDTFAHGEVLLGIIQPSLGERGTACEIFDRDGNASSHSQEHFPRNVQHMLGAPLLKSLLPTSDSKPANIILKDINDHRQDACTCPPSTSDSSNILIRHDHSPTNRSARSRSSRRRRSRTALSLSGSACAQTTPSGTNASKMQRWRNEDIGETLAGIEDGC
jgi:hypothetical protein